MQQVAALLNHLVARASSRHRFWWRLAAIDPPMPIVLTRSSPRPPAVP